MVVVKGDQFTTDFWDELDTRRLPRVLWLYDELRRTELDADLLRRVGPVASYSARDVVDLRNQGVAAVHLPLAYDHRLVPVAPRPRARRGRLRRRALPRPRGDPRRARRRRGPGPGVRPRLVRPIRSTGCARWRRAARPCPRAATSTAAEAYRRMAEAAATLNLHGDQDGFTMRTFEACGVGAVQLVDRADVAGLYTPGEDLATYSSLRRARRPLPTRARATVDGARACARPAGGARSPSTPSTTAWRVLESLWG